jgi:hypothetical protein
VQKEIDKNIGGIPSSLSATNQQYFYLKTKQPVVFFFHNKSAPTNKQTGGGNKYRGCLVWRKL